MSRSLSAVVALAIAVAVLASGCGSSSSSSASSSTAASTSATSTQSTAAASPSGSPIVLGNLAQFSGPPGSGNLALPKLLQFWANQINSSGGINGHPVKVISDDTAGDPTKSLSLAKSLVEQNGVIGFVANNWPTVVAQVAPYVDQKKVPVVGGTNDTQDYFQDPMLFPIAADTTTLATGVGKVAKGAGIHKAALWVCNLGAPCTDTGKLVAGGLKGAGISIVDNQTVALTSTSFQSNCLQAQQSGATALQYVADPATLQRAMEACLKIGYRPTWLVFQTQIGGSFTSIGGGLKALGVTVSFPPFLTSGSPSLDQWAAATKGVPAEQLGPAISSDWASMKVMEAALKAGIKPGQTPTSSALLDGLYSLKGYTAEGLTPPLTYHVGQPAAKGSCWFDITLENQKFSTPSGGLTPSCV